MKLFIKSIGWIVLAIALAGTASAQNSGGFPFNRTPHYISSSNELQAFAATNKSFAAAVGYILATLDGRQPEELPAGVTPGDIKTALVEVFPKSDFAFDQPINFYGKAVDENNRPVADADIHLELTGFVIHGRRIVNLHSDRKGLFSLTNELGARLDVSVSKKGYYSSRTNGGAGTAQYTTSFGQPFKPDSATPVLYYFHKKGNGANSLITSQAGMRDDFLVKTPFDGTKVTVDLMHRKIGDGPLEISQIKPEHVTWQAGTNWSFSLKLPEGGFVEEDVEFPFYPPRSGYQPSIEFHFIKGQSNWTTDIRKDYYIKFGKPSLYGHLHLENSISSDSVRLKYTINPDGDRYLEPRNDTSPLLPPPPDSKPKLATNSSGILSNTAPTLSVPRAPIYNCITIAGSPGVKGAADGIYRASSFNDPVGIATDADGSIYVADDDNTIRRLVRTGTNWIVSTIVGIAGKRGGEDGTNTDARLAHPRGLAMDQAGNLYLADTWTVRKIAHVGNNWVVTTIAGRTHVFGNADGTNSDAQFNNVAGITTDRSGNIFVTDVSNSTIRKLTPTGSNWVVTTIAGTSKTVREGNVIHAFEESTDGTNSEAHFFAPFGVAADSHGNLYVVDYMTSVVRKITQQGTNWVVMTIAGLTNQSGYADGTNSGARFDHPRAIAIDKDDNIYVDDTRTDTIRIIKQAGTNFVVRTIIGLPWRWGYADGTNNTAQFDSASAIAVDGNGNIYLADSGNKVIRQIIPPSVPQGRIIFPVVGSIVGILALLIVILLSNRFFRESKSQT